MRRFAVLFAASALALQKVPLKRQGTATRRRLSVGGRTDLKTCEDNVFYAEASLGTPPQMVAGLGRADAGRGRGRAPPGGCAEPDGRRPPREGVLGREPGRVGSWRNEYIIGC